MRNENEKKGEIVPSVVAMALDNFPRVAEERRKAFDRYFEARDEDKRRRQELAKETRVAAHRDVLHNRMGCLHPTLRIVNILRDIPAAMRPAVWAQASVIVSDEKWDDENAIPEDERVKVVFDRSRTGKAMQIEHHPSDRPSGPGVLSRRGSHTLPFDLARKYYEEAKQGIPIKPRKPGRPSADDVWAMNTAREMLESEGATPPV